MKKSCIREYVRHIIGHTVPENVKNTPNCPKLILMKADFSCMWI